jgi:DNA-binding transcriptional LysR family regulator
LSRGCPTNIGLGLPLCGFRISWASVLTQLRAFLVALEEGSLNRAAVRLRTSQSALSRQMQALENEVGGALLERTTTGIRPTDAGYALASSMQRVLDDYDAALTEARRLARGQRDLIRVGYLGSAAQMFLDPALSALRRTHPEVKVKLLDLSPGEQIIALRKGEIDLALIGQEGSLLSSEFYTRKLATLPVVAVMPSDHPLASRKRVSLKELRNECFIGSPEQDLPGRDRWIIQLCRRAGFRPKFVEEADSVSNMFTLIGSESAVTLVPGYLKNLRVAGIAMVQLSDTNATWDFLIVWQRGRTAKSLQALLALLAALRE